MYKRFVQFVDAEMPNVFYKVSKDDMLAAETRMGLPLPTELRQFYEEVGYGFFCHGISDAQWDRSLINRVVDPEDMAEMVCEKYHPTRPHGLLTEGEMPFFDMGWRDYLLVNALSEQPNQVLWPNGKVMIESVQEFFGRLYEHAGFYAGGPGTI